MNRSHWRRTGIRVILLALGIGGACWLIVAYRYQAWDFRNNLWGPAHLLLRGKDPYSLEALAQLSADWGVPFFRSVWFPAVIGVGLPLGALPLPAAANIWLLISLAAALASEVLVYTGTTRRQQSRDLVMVALAVMVFAPLYAHLNQGQASLVVLASCVIAWALLEREQPTWAGVFLSLGWAKPQLVLLVWPALAWLAVKRGRGGSFLLGWFASSVVQTIPLWVLQPSWPAGYLEALRSNPTWLQPNIYSVVAHWSGSQVLGWMVALVALGAAGFWLASLWRHASSLAALTWTLALTPILSPYTWSYDQVLLLPLLVLTLSQDSRRLPRIVWWIVFLVCQAFYVALRLHTSSDVWYLWLPPILLATSALLALPGRMHGSER